MPDRRITHVRWGGIDSPQALYGSALRLEPSGGIRFVNPLMPSGTVMQEWYSFTDYQAVRESPTLPLLHHGKRYRIEPQLATEPADSVYFDVRYYDRFGEDVGADVLHPPAYDFVYPDDCHHYTIRLLNGGCDELRFTAFALIEEAGDGEQ